jgi:Tfp pilus assembly PilM family ATPase
LKRGIGVYIGPKEVIAASVSLVQGTPNLERFAVESLEEADKPQTSDAKEKTKLSKPTVKKELTREAGAVKRALEKIGGARTRVIAAFNPFHLVTRYFEIPSIPKKEWESAVRYEASRYIPFKISETVVDFKMSEETSKETNSKILCVTAAAVKINILHAHVNHLRSVSAKVETVEPVFLALSRTVAMGEKLENGKIYGFLFLDDDGSVNITLSRSGVTYLSRDFLLSEDQKANETRFYEELKVSIDFARQKTGDGKVEKVFIAGSGDLPFWSDFLTSVFGKEIIFQPALFPVKQVVPSNILSKLIVPIGLALHGLNQKSPLGAFSLVPPAEREERPEKIRRLVGYEFLAVALFFLVLRFAILEPYALIARKQMVREMGPQAETAPSLVGLPITELQQMKNEIGKQTSQLGQFSKDRSAFVERLKALTSKIPRVVWVEQMTYGAVSKEEFRVESGKPSSKSMILQGQCYTASPEEDVKAINQWAKELNEDKTFLGDFKKVTVADIRREQYLGRDTTMFRLVVD